MQLLKRARDGCRCCVALPDACKYCLVLYCIVFPFSRVVFIVVRPILRDGVGDENQNIPERIHVSLVASWAWTKRRSRC